MNVRSKKKKKKIIKIKKHIRITSGTGEDVGEGIEAAGLATGGSSAGFLTGPRASILPSCRDCCIAVMREVFAEASSSAEGASAAASELMNGRKRKEA